MKAWETPQWDKLPRSKQKFLLLTSGMIYYKKQSNVQNNSRYTSDNDGQIIKNPEYKPVRKSITFINNPIESASTKTFYSPEYVRKKNRDKMIDKYENEIFLKERLSEKYFPETREKTEEIIELMNQFLQTQKHSIKKK